MTLQDLHSPTWILQTISFVDWVHTLWWGSNRAHSSKVTPPSHIAHTFAFFLASYMMIIVVSHLLFACLKCKSSHHFSKRKSSTASERSVSPRGQWCVHVSHCHCKEKKCRLFIFKELTSRLLRFLLFIVWVTQESFKLFWIFWLNTYTLFSFQVVSRQNALSPQPGNFVCDTWTMVYSK